MLAQLPMQIVRVGLAGTFIKTIAIETCKSLYDVTVETESDTLTDYASIINLKIKM